MFLGSALKTETQMRKIIDEKTRTFIDEESEGYIRGIVHISDNYVEFGWFK